ncbi:MAG: ABC transporter permease [Oceanococcus sp.]
MTAEPQNSQLIPELPVRRTGRNSFEVFLTSLHAFLLRELKNQFGRSRLGYFWALAEPAAAVTIFTLLHAFIRGNHSSIYQEDPVLFFVFGVIPYFVFSNALSQTQGVCSTQKGLFNYRQIKPIDIMIARSLIDALMMLGVLVTFLVGWSWLGQELPKIQVLELAAALGSLYMLGFSVGLLFEVFATVYPDLRKIFAIITRPLFFVSGVFFTIGMLPGKMAEILIWVPILQGVDLARDAVLPAYDSPASWFYLWGCILFVQCVGLAAYQRYQFRLI